VPTGGPRALNQCSRFLGTCSPPYQWLVNLRPSSLFTAHHFPTVHFSLLATFLAFSSSVLETGASMVLMATTGRLLDASPAWISPPASSLLSLSTSSRLHLLSLSPVADASDGDDWGASTLSMQWCKQALSAAACQSNGEARNHS
jgi:hypothetical protein